ncbi:MAG: dihydrofolate reductase family protein [Armatimonadota bacterium]
MRKIIVSEFVTVDGVMESPEKWSCSLWSDEAGQYKHQELFAADALLLGRTTYEGFAAAWPTMTDDDGFADRMNSLPKYVASTTLREAMWNAAPIQGDFVDEVLRLKQEPGQDILVFGSADLVHALRQQNLVDEYRLMVFPVVAGIGKRLFQDGTDSVPLKLIDTQTFSTGVVVLTYQAVSAF